eukprot:TRINITY_DN4372_c2_g1_i1.p5 TRINITY_DN4372_c2_g1~~TRINITY_DN4372_c2_g1_i1.p5  ORF type:complete len:243 (+),score=96.41 TRINITY_DN4372_c2_g1_i1:1235-1963(+)
MRLFIAIDDTDNPDTMGTGRLSRLLAADLEARGLTRGASVTRHQLLVHPDIPYTSHNSSACLEAEALAPPEEVFAAARKFMLANLHDGANPGLCLAPVGAVPPALADLGKRAQKVVLPVEEGYALAESEGIHTWRHGPTGQGIIGALSGVGLRSTGDDGRFIELEGIREVGGVLSVDEIITRTAVTSVVSGTGQELAGTERVDTLDWIRPTLRDGSPVMEVESRDGVWQPKGKKKKKGSAKK